MTCEGRGPPAGAGGPQSSLALARHGLDALLVAAARLLLVGLAALLLDAARALLALELRALAGLAAGDRRLAALVAAAVDDPGIALTLVLAALALVALLIRRRVLIAVSAGGAFTV